MIASSTRPVRSSSSASGGCVSIEPSEVMADGRLRVVQLPRGRGDGAVSGYGIEHAQPGHVQHPSIVSMDHDKNWHWTNETWSPMLTVMSASITESGTQ